MAVEQVEQPQQVWQAAQVVAVAMLLPLAAQVTHHQLHRRKVTTVARAVQARAVEAVAAAVQVP